MIDYIDKQILTIIQKDARIANSEIARQVTGTIGSFGACQEIRGTERDSRV